MNKKLLGFVIAISVIGALAETARAQPVPQTWRPPSNCSNGQFLKWDTGVSPARWTCGTATAFSTLNVIPKGDGTGLTASSWTDDGTTTGTSLSAFVASGAGAGITGTFKVGSDTGSTTDARNGYSVNVWSDGNLYVDHKTNASGTTFYRFGHGAQTGAASLWMQIQHATGLTTMPFALTVQGNATLGDSVTDAHGVSGVISVLGPGGGNVGAYRSVNEDNTSAFWSFGTYNDLSYKWHYYNGSVWDEKCSLSAAGVLNCDGLQVNGTNVATTSNVSGTIGYSARFTGANTVGNGGLLDDGTNVSLIGQLRLNGISDANWYLSKDGATHDIYLNGASSGSRAFRIRDSSNSNDTRFAVELATGNTTINGSATLGDATTDTVYAPGYVGIGVAPTSNAGLILWQGSRTNGTYFYNDAAGLTGHSNLVTINHVGSFDTTAAYKDNIGMYLSNGATRSAGANALNNYGLIIDTWNGQSNFALRVDRGDVILNNVSGSTLISGPTTIGDSTADNHTINGRTTGATTGFANGFSWTLTGSAATYSLWSVYSVVTGTADTTAGARDSQAGRFVSNVTRSAGSNNLTNYGVVAVASGGQTNMGVYSEGTEYSFYSPTGQMYNAGVVQFDNYIWDNNSNVHINDGLDVTNDLNVANNTSLGDSSGDVLDVNGDLAKFGATDGQIYIHNGTLNAQYTINSEANLAVNYLGYNAGTSQWRGFEIYDGRGAIGCSMNGQTKVWNCVGGLQENGTAVLSGSIADNYVIKGSGGNAVNTAFPIVDTAGGLSLGDDAADVVDINGNVTKFGGTADGMAYFNGVQLNFGLADASNSAGYINFEGNGTSYFRNLIIADGKQATVATFTGSDKSLAVVGNLSTSANLGVGDTSPDYKVDIEVDAGRMVLDHPTSNSWATFDFARAGARRLGMGLASNSDDWQMYRATGAAGAEVETNVMTVENANGNVTFANQVTVGGILDVNNALAKFGATDGQVYINGSTINGEYAQNAESTLYVNDAGYQAGTTQFRNFVIRDGKGVTGCTFTGSTKILNCVGGLQVNGVNVATFSTNNAIPKGNGSGLVASTITDDGTYVTLSPVTGVQMNTGYLWHGSSINTYLSASSGIGFHFNADLDNQTGYINYSGYGGGTARDRNLVIGNGKGVSIATFTGSTLAAAFAGNVTLGDTPGSDTHQINGKTTITSGTPGAVVAASADATLTLERTGANHQYLQFRGSTTTQQGIIVAGGGQPADGAIVYSNGTWNFVTATTGRMNIDASGTLHVGDQGTCCLISNNVDVAKFYQTGTGQTGTEKSVITVSNTGTYNTTAAGYTTRGVSVDLTASRSAGANPLYNYAYYASVSNAQFNYTFFGNGGQFWNQDAASFGSTITATSNISSTSGYLDGVYITNRTRVNDYTRGFEIYEEFLNAQRNNASPFSQIGGGWHWYGGINGLDAEANRPGVLGMQARTNVDTLGGSAAPRYARVFKGDTGGGQGWFAGGGQAKVAGAFTIYSLSPAVDDSDSYTFHIGLFDTMTTTGATYDNPPNGIFCRVAGDSTNVQVCTAEADSMSCIETTPTIAIAEDAWIRCEFTVNAAGTQVDFTVSNITAGTSGTASRTTNIPNDNTHPVGLGATLDSIDNLGFGIVGLDYLFMEQTFTTAR